MPTPLILALPVVHFKGSVSVIRSVSVVKGMKGSYTLGHVQSISGRD